MEFPADKRWHRMLTLPPGIFRYASQRDDHAIWLSSQNTSYVYVILAPTAHPRRALVTMWLFKVLCSIVNAREQHCRLSLTTLSGSAPFVTSMGLGASGSSGLMGQGMSSRRAPGLRWIEQGTTSKPTIMYLNHAGYEPHESCTKH